MVACRPVAAKQLLNRLQEARLFRGGGRSQQILAEEGAGPRRVPARRSTRGAIREVAQRLDLRQLVLDHRHPSLERGQHRPT